MKFRNRSPSSLSISINGGNGPYLKTVYDAASNVIYNGNSPTINNLSAGMYTFVITDNNGCIYSESLLSQRSRRLIFAEKQLKSK